MGTRLDRVIPFVSLTVLVIVSIILKVKGSHWYRETYKIAIIRVFHM